MKEDLPLLVARMKAAAHPLRLRVLTLLNSEQLCVCQVAEVLQVPISSVSEALRELRRVGIVSEQKKGRWVFVTLRQPPSPFIQGLILETAAIPALSQAKSMLNELRDIGAPTVCRNYKNQPKHSASSESHS